MYSLLTLSIFLTLLCIILSSHVKSNSISKLERNNVLNKALWMKRYAENNPGLSVFRLNTFDVDEILDNNNNFKGENDQPTMYFSTFNERSKRDTSEVIKDSKRDLSTTKPIKIVDDSYKEAGLLPQTDHYNIIHNIPLHPYTFVVQSKPKFFGNMSENFEKIMKPLSDNSQNLTKTANTKFYLKEESKKNNAINKIVLDKSKLPWLGKGLSSSTKANDTVTKSDEESSTLISPNSISQRELFKVIAMLTRTFKRIIKQHNDIKVIHSRLQNLNNNFMRNSEQLIQKFQHFDTKYNNVVRLNEKLNEKLKMIKDQQLTLKNKEETLTKHVLEFEKERKQFLIQQNLFFNIQKQILAQNEKITYKQAQIANRQTIISHRQSNIAKIFKEAHQTFTTEKVTATENKNTNVQPAAGEVKIDLFSVKPDKRLKTLDPDILKTKDEQSIDDLIFKFYFNNTFIDDFIRDQLLGSIVNRPEVHDLKIRKPREGAESTALFPVTKTGEKIRQRRWIKHPKKSRKNETSTVMSMKAKLMSAKNMRNDNGDPFIKMAMTFCTELGQTNNVQAFNWCVEKTLRRLKVIDSKKTAATKPSTVLATSVTTTLAPTTTTQTMPKKEDAEASILSKYFPDNDELEEKLKEYDLKPDTEGNVYYDRSLHISDIDPKDVDYGGGVSDVLPGFESDSKLDVKPALDLQTLRRLDARRLSDKIKKIKMARK